MHLHLGPVHRRLKIYRKRYTLVICMITGDIYPRYDIMTIMLEMGY